eukprot:768503-Hanusia_phi.AAC.2
MHELGAPLQTLCGGSREGSLWTHGNGGKREAAAAAAASMELLVLHYSLHRLSIGYADSSLGLLFFSLSSPIQSSAAPSSLGTHDPATARREREQHECSFQIHGGAEDRGLRAVRLWADRMFNQEQHRGCMEEVLCEPASLIPSSLMLWTCADSGGRDAGSRLPSHHSLSCTGGVRARQEVYRPDGQGRDQRRMSGLVRHCPFLNHLQASEQTN